jgi:hypothetical protein
MLPVRHRTFDERLAAALKTGRREAWPWRKPTTRA